LAQASPVAADRPLADRRPSEDDGSGRDNRPGAELERRQLLARGGRARRQRGLLADDRVVKNPAALADHRARIDDRGLGDLRHAGAATREAWSCSSTRTTATPSRAACRGSLSPRTSARKRAHSSRSGSTEEFSGPYVSPVTV